MPAALISNCHLSLALSKTIENVKQAIHHKIIIVSFEKPTPLSKYDQKPHRKLLVENKFTILPFNKGDAIRNIDRTDYIQKPNNCLTESHKNCYKMTRSLIKEISKMVDQL